LAWRGLRGRPFHIKPLGLLSFPRVEQLLDVAPLRRAELEGGEQSPRLVDVVVLDRRLEVLAQRDRLAQLPSQPAKETDLGRFHAASVARALARSAGMIALERRAQMPMPTSVPGSIDLYWLPLGAGGHSVRLNGRVFEWFAARLERRERCDLYHSALQVHVPEGRFVIEQAPAWGDSGDRGVVAEGAVGMRLASRLRLFRYEIRCWRDGVIPDIAEAVDSPQRLGDDVDRARRLLELVPQVPRPVWGRDELHAGEMWNSNSLISWLVVRSGLDVDSVRLPRRGRAPGWGAGILVARREETG